MAEAMEGAGQASEVARLEAELAECYRLSGADPDGAPDAMLAREAVAEVRRLRAELDEAQEREAATVSEVVGQVSVDSGTIALIDPAHLGKDFPEPDTMLPPGRASAQIGPFGCGVALPTGIGDGTFPVSVERRPHTTEPLAVTIRFDALRDNPHLSDELREQIAEALNPPPGLRHSERELWRQSSQAPRVREVLARLAREREAATGGDRVRGTIVESSDPALVGREGEFTVRWPEGKTFEEADAAGEVKYPAVARAVAKEVGEEPPCDEQGERPASWTPYEVAENLRYQSMRCRAAIRRLEGCRPGDDLLEAARALVAASEDEQTAYELALEVLDDRVEDPELVAQLDAPHEHRVSLPDAARLTRELAEGAGWRGTTPNEGTRRAVIHDALRRQDVLSETEVRELGDAIESALLHSTVAEDALPKVELSMDEPLREVAAGLQREAIEAHHALDGARIDRGSDLPDRVRMIVQRYTEALARPRPSDHPVVEAIDRLAVTLGAALRTLLDRSAPTDEQRGRRLHAIEAAVRLWLDSTPELRAMALPYDRETFVTDLAGCVNVHLAP